MSEASYQNQAGPTAAESAGQPENPFESANIISRIFFCWLNPFIRQGFNRNLELNDLYRVPRENLSQGLSGKLRVQWNRELGYLKEGAVGKKPSLVRALCRAFGVSYLLAGIWVLVGEIMVRPMQAVSLGWLIRDVNHYLNLDPLTQADQLDAAYWQVFYDGLLLIFLSVVVLITMHPYVFCTQHLGMKVRIACCHLIYCHALKLSNAAIGQTTVGQMVNLLTNDVNRFDLSLNYIQFLIIAPLQALLCIIILSIWYLGFYATISGSLLLVFYVPFQSLMGRWFGRLRHLTAARTDERIRLMNEIVPAMRVIKMYTWEDPFAALVELARKNEVRLIRYTSVLRGINMGLFFVSSKVILFICFITYVLLGYTLDPEIVFVAITLFNSVRLFMTLFFPYGVSQLAETLISCNRLQEFLLLPKQEPSTRIERSGDTDSHRCQPADIIVESKDASANWTIINKNFAIDEKDLDTAKNQKKSSTAVPVVVAGSGQIQQPAGKQVRGSLGGSKSSLFYSTTNVHLSHSKLSEIGLTEPAGGSLTTGQTAVTALRNISYSVRAGELMVIVGRVGSGKSSLLMSILGELPLAAGRMKITGRISYASQEPWIFAGTVRENVLFEKPYDEERYKRVIWVCSLDKDMELFPQGDLTVVGQRGVSLSGGQRARINLARAIYMEADIYLLDDPLSAVDATVAKHIFNECITGFLKDKAVLLATHQTQFIRRETKVLFLQDGRQISCKNFADNKELQVFIGSAWEKSDSESAMSAANRRTSRLKLDSDAPAKVAEASNSNSSRGSSDHEEATTAAGGEEGSSGSGGRAHSDPAAGRSGEAPIRQSVESSASQNIGASIYWYYLRVSKSFLLVSILATANLGTQALFNGSDFWLSYWTDTEQRKAANGGSSDYPPVSLTDTLSLQQNALVYTILISSLFVLTLIRTTCFFVVCMRSSINLHKHLFRSVIRAPIKFFDCNPIGMLLNRVSNDMGVVDDQLPPTAFDAIEIFINVLGTLITVGAIFPLSLIPSVLLCAMVGVVRLLYIRLVRSIKALEGTTRSPVYSHLATSLNGLATIRAYRAEPQFERKFEDYQDTHSSAWFMFVAASRWLGSSLDLLSLAYICVITVAMTLSIGTVTGAQIGLAISSSLFLSGSFQWGVRQSTELESQMTSVARIKEYSELPQEPAQYSEPGQGPPREWPQRGTIEFKGVNLRYFEEDEPVLKQLTFKIEAAEKIGVVGRTGAGKSSIIAVLFRLTEPEGQILIDDLDTKSIGLHELRKKLSIIPQEPTLFNGPIRRNLDPFGDFRDVDLWRALEQVKLADVVRQLPGALDAELNEGGSNFSVGERQLICLARAVLRQNRIIVLDEATANVDPGTDSFIQRTISENFTQCTRITIAHRLHTIMDSDRVLVMDAGQVREFDAPHLLLQREDGLFSAMVRNTGKSAARLRKVARNSYERRQAAAAAAAATSGQAPAP